MEGGMERQRRMGLVFRLIIDQEVHSRMAAFGNNFRMFVEEVVGGEVRHNDRFFPSNIDDTISHCLFFFFLVGYVEERPW